MVICRPQAGREGEGMPKYAPGQAHGRGGPSVHVSDFVNHYAGIEHSTNSAVLECNLLQHFTGWPCGVLQR